MRFKIFSVCINLCLIFYLALPFEAIANDTNNLNNTESTENTQAPPEIKNPQIQTDLKEIKLPKNDLRELFQKNNAIVYALVIRTFNASDLNKNEIIEPELGEKTGTFINAIERLDELKELGINTIHLLPITKTGKKCALGNAGSVYSLASFTEIDPCLDDKTNLISVFEEAKLFVDECRKRNIRVMLDLPACASYDLFLEKPQLFYLDDKKNPIIPLDWKDVRLLKFLNDDGTLNQELLQLHRDFVDMCLKLGIGGIRADVASIKPPELWRELISYARGKDPQFAFLAEASDSWTNSVDKRIKQNNYKELFKQGFDAYYGSWFKIDEWGKAEEINRHSLFNTRLFRNGMGKKSSIGSFATHDEPSPIQTKGVALAKMITVLNSTLPKMNPYFISGFESGDRYNYSFNRAKAPFSETDSKTYFVHPNKLDIFNFSRKPSGDYTEIAYLMKKSLKFRQENNDIITKGNFVPLKLHAVQFTGSEVSKKIKKLKNNKIIENTFAFARSYKNDSIFVIGNLDFKNSAKVKLVVKNLRKAKKVRNFYCCTKTQFSEDLITSHLAPGEIQVFVVEGFRFK